MLSPGIEAADTLSTIELVAAGVSPAQPKPNAQDQRKRVTGAVFEDASATVTSYFVRAGGHAAAHLAVQ